MAQHGFACQLVLGFFHLFTSLFPGYGARRWGMLHQVVLRVLDAFQESWDGYIGLRDSKNNKIWCCSYLLGTGHCTCVSLTSLFPALTLLKINREVLVAGCGEKHLYALFTFHYYYYYY